MSKYALAGEILKIVGPLAWEWASSLFINRKKILILGSGGVGKSSLGHLLSKGMSMREISDGYKQSYGTEPFELKESGIKARLIVAAGQEHRRDSWGTLLSDLQNGKIAGVILVNSFGYHSIGPLGLAGQKEYQKLRENGCEEEFLQEHLSARRKDELAVLRYIAPYLKSMSKKIWLLTAITKEDLWFDEYDNALAHYNNGQYKSTIEEIRQSLGTQFFRHEVVSLSLAIKPFITGRNEHLAPTSVAYNQSHQCETSKQFFNALQTLCSGS